MAHKDDVTLDLEVEQSFVRSRQRHINAIEAQSRSEPSSPKSQSVFKKLKIKKTRSPATSPYRSRQITFTPSSRFQKDSSDEERVEQKPPPRKSNKNKVRAKWRKVMRNGTSRNSGNRSNNYRYTDRTHELVGLLLQASAQKAKLSANDKKHEHMAQAPDIVISKADSTSQNEKSPISNDVFDFDDQISLEKVSLKIETAGTGSDALTLTSENLFSAIVKPLQSEQTEKQHLENRMISSQAAAVLDDIGHSKHLADVFTQTSEVAEDNLDLKSVKVIEKLSVEIGIQTESIDEETESILRNLGDSAQTEFSDSGIQTFSVASKEVSTQAISVSKIQISTQAGSPWLKSLDVASQSVSSGSAAEDIKKIDVASQSISPESATENTKKNDVASQSVSSESAAENTEKIDAASQSVFSESAAEDIKKVDIASQSESTPRRSSTLTQTEGNVAVMKESATETIEVASSSVKTLVAGTQTTNNESEAHRQTSNCSTMTNGENSGPSESVSVGLDPVQEILMDGDSNKLKVYDKKVDSTTIKEAAGSLKDTIKCENIEEKPKKKETSTPLGKESEIENKKADLKDPLEVMDTKQNGSEVTDKQISAKDSSNDSEKVGTKQNGPEVSNADDDVSLLKTKLFHRNKVFYLLYILYYLILLLMFSNSSTGRFLQVLALPCFSENAQIKTLKCILFSTPKGFL